MKKLNLGLLSGILLVSSLNAFPLKDYLFDIENSNKYLYFNNSFMSNYDIKETDKKYLLEIDMPGFKKEDIKIEFKNNNILWINAKRNSIKGEEKFQMNMKFDKEINEKETEAKLENNILKIEILKNIISNQNNQIIKIK